ncbi:MAG: hypothetical protein V9E94_19675 [Microthrixaceae bacterium]
MSLTVVAASLGLIALSAWCHAVLAHEERYLRAVEPLARSRRFGRIAGTAVALGSRHRLGRHRGWPASASRTLGSITTWTMSTRAFRPIWIAGNRAVHRRREPSLKLAVVMVALASIGTLKLVSTKIDRT